MGEIRILPPALADRIAAGEVVERPASVLRELLDNAIDAGAIRIEVDLDDGGRELVQVADDGRGMAPDDAVLAFERHATSKIRTPDDLDAVATLGFRGEALAAIAAVSRVELLTRPAGSGEATRVVLDRGTLVSAGPAGRAPGTTVAVGALFHGIPARRKFLRSAETELDHCLKTATRIALARPEVGLVVRAAGREHIAAAAGDAGTGRIAALLGGRVASAMVPVEGDAGPMVLRGWAGRADLHRAVRDAMHVFVNRRPVRDPLLIRAIADAYRQVLPGGRFPVVVLALELPADAVDVNVHPAKSEVRFHRPQEVRALVTGILARALGTREAVPHFGGPSAAWAAPAWHGGPSVASGAPVAGAPAPLPFAAHEADDGAPLPGAPPGDGPQVLAQYRDCYIVAADAQGLLVVDQHVAHERLLFERLIADAGRGPLPRQVLLFPHALEVAPEVAAAAERHAAALERLGFVCEPFGQGTLLVREVPVVFGRHPEPHALLELLDVLRQGRAADASDLDRHLLATVACHSAVRKGMPLGREQMAYILHGLAACDVPSHCPHGRVVSLRVDLGALDRGFDRA